MQEVMERYRSRSDCFVILPCDLPARKKFFVSPDSGTTS